MGQSWVQILHQTPELAHLVEHQTCNLTVTGSIPVLLTIPRPGYGHLASNESKWYGSNPKVVQVHYFFALLCWCSAERCCPR
jgi:hypothetical protein